MAKPSKFTDELFDEILNELSFSDKGVYKICREKDLNPKVFFDWIKENQILSNKYARAKEMQADFLAEQILDISDSTSNDTKINDLTGAESANHEWISRSKLRVDSRKWLASKLAPKKYGDKLDVSTLGEKIDQKTVIEVVRTKPTG